MVLCVCVRASAIMCVVCVKVIKEISLCMSECLIQISTN